MGNVLEHMCVGPPIPDDGYSSKSTYNLTSNQLEEKLSILQRKWGQFENETSCNESKQPLDSQPSCKNFKLQLGGMDQQIEDQNVPFNRMRSNSNQLNQGKPKNAGLSTKNRLNFVFLKQFEEEEKDCGSDSDASFEVQKNPYSLKETVMDRKLSLMRKRTRLGYLRKEQNRLKAGPFDLGTSFTMGRPKKLKNQQNLLTELIQEIENEGDQNSPRKFGEERQENADHFCGKTTGEGIEEPERKSEPTPDIYKEDDSFLKSIYEAMGEFPPEANEDHSQEGQEHQQSQPRIMLFKNTTFENTNEITKKEEEMGSIVDAEMLAHLLEGPENQEMEPFQLGNHLAQAFDNNKDHFDDHEGFNLGEFFIKQLTPKKNENDPTPQEPNYRSLEGFEIHLRTQQSVQQSLTKDLILPVQEVQ